MAVLDGKLNLTHKSLISYYLKTYLEECHSGVHREDLDYHRLIVHPHNAFAEIRKKHESSE